MYTTIAIIGLYIVYAAFFAPDEIVEVVEKEQVVEEVKNDTKVE